MWKECIDHTVTLNHVYLQKDIREIMLLSRRLTAAHILITIAQNSSTY